MLTRRDMLAAIPATLASQSTAPARRPRPNVIVITMDDLGATDLGCFGAGDLQTPHLDALASGGAQCVNWYSNAPVCAPSRASIMTGRYPERTGLTANGNPLNAESRTLASLLKAHSYRTAAVGKWHLGSTAEARPNARGFDYLYGFLSGCVDFYSHRFYWSDPRVVNYHDLWRNNTEIFEDGQYLTERITAEALGFIDRSHNEPFFLYLAYNAPHYPMHAPQKYVERFAHLAPERRMYAAMLAAVDDGIGEIRSRLQQRGLTEDTLIVFVADNGATTEKRAGLDQQYATAGNNGVYRGFKFSLFDGGVHVPAIVYFPRRIRPHVCRELLASMDIVPTVLEAAGAAVPSGYVIDGQSALQTLAFQRPMPQRSIFWNQGGQLAAREGRWKLVVNGRVYGRSPESNQPLQGEDSVFLSDIENDPGEARNLRRQHPEVVDRLTTSLEQWRSQWRA